MKTIDTSPTPMKALRPEPAPRPALHLPDNRDDFDRLIATGRVKLARSLSSLLRSHPFHGHVAAGWRGRPDAIVPTMGVGWLCGGVQLVWNPFFVNRITEIELAGVILHEVHHVVLRHMFLFPEQADPPPEFDAFAAIVAEEITVNEFVTLPLPGSPMLLEHFQKKCPSLKPMESTRDRYRKLYDPARARRDHNQRQRLSKAIEDQLEEQVAKHLGRSSAAGDGGDHMPDSHADWGSFQRGGAAAALAVSVATAQAMAKHGGTLSPKLRELIKRAHAVAGGAAGSEPGGMFETLAGTARARISWQKVLRRLLAVDHVSEPTYYRPPRRFPNLVGVLPGTRRVPAKLRILAAIDTSGSMSAAMLDEIAAELRMMSRSYDVSVVEFDAQIQRRYRLEPSSMTSNAADPLVSMKGRGGTNFRPIFSDETLAWGADGKSELSGIVVFTDGHGPAPEKPPRVPVIWVLIGGVEGGGAVLAARRPANWGQAVRAGRVDGGP